MNHRPLLAGLLAAVVLTRGTAGGVAHLNDIDSNNSWAPQLESPPTKPLQADDARGGWPPPGRGPLLAEGGFLIQTRGTMHHHEPTGSWRFRIARDDPHQPRYELTILPCAMLSDMQQIVEAAKDPPRREIVFELTGQVLRYHDRNYLLPTYVPRIDADKQRAATTRPDGPRAETLSSDTAEEILRNLDLAVGPVAQGQSGHRAHQPASQPPPPPGAVMLSRRGRMIREAGGAWSWVFDADAEGLADPPMILLPCRLLQRMEQYPQRSRTHAAMVISGRVFRYQGRRYLLPTSFQIPHDRTTLHP
ncbi:MAG: hypothetical protein O6758_09755 [Planctomycetota bacterium]|nr:hypothetical protein [Planctomycetota bacterium]